MQSGIRCMLMRGGTSKGAYFLKEDLPADAAERDDLLLRIMGSPDPRQIDGIGGAHPLTSKVAIVSRSATNEADIDFLFAQVSVNEGLVDTTPNCGNILAGVAPFAIERGLVPVTGPETIQHHGHAVVDARHLDAANALDPPACREKQSADRACGIQVVRWYCCRCTPSIASPPS